MLQKIPFKFTSVQTSLYFTMVVFFYFTTPNGLSPFPTAKNELMDHMKDFVVDELHISDWRYVWIQEKYSVIVYWIYDMAHFDNIFNEKNWVINWYWQGVPLTGIVLPGEF